MPGSDHGAGTGEQNAPTTTTRTIGARSASPAKRSASDMEGQHNELKESDDLDHEVQDDRERHIERHEQAIMDSQSNTAQTRSPSTSFSAETDRWQYSVAEIDDQVRKVQSLQAESLDVGQKGIVVSNKWLARVMSRSSEGLKNPEYPKDAREGAIGGVDNSNIVSHGAFDPPLLHDCAGHNYVALKPGLVLGDDFEVFNNASWGEVMASYGLSTEQCQIDRYVQDTAPPGSLNSNLQYELYPPIITICKVPSPQEQEQPRSSSSFEMNRKKSEQRARGQNSPEDPVRLVSSRQEKFQQFLRRSKQAAEIPLSHKVRVWKVLNPASAEISSSRPPSPPQSRVGSPRPAGIRDSKLVVETATFKAMETGKDLEFVDIRDESNNGNYNGSSTMETFGLFEDTTLLLEEMIGGPGGGDFASSSDSKKSFKSLMGKKPGSRPASTTASGRTSPAPSSGGIMTRGRQRRDGRTRGTIGLTNLGNTCYMNSALQCIRSVEELAIYFLSEKYKREINTNNPLGHNGAMAKQYASVLNSIYADNTSGAFSPNSFKKTLGQLQPLFSGFGQQDSQEFLSFLVDALHEDLNRIHKKPYIENPDSDDNTVHDPKAIEELGDTYRANHAKRNDSVAMDLFNGFYKNTMECPECDKISITFDPYSLVTLQLPTERNFQHTVTLIPLHGTPVNHMIDMEKNSTIRALKENIASKHDGVSAQRLWMAEVYSHKLYKVFEDVTTLGEAGISDNDFIFVFELTDIPSNAPVSSKKKPTIYSSYLSSSKSDDEIPDMSDPKADCFAVPVFSRRANRFGSGWEMILHPMYITVTREEAQDYDMIFKKVLLAISRLTSRPILSEFDTSNSETAETSTGIGEAEENGQISDRSAPSEDGYVEVSINKARSERTDAVINAGLPTRTAQLDNRAAPPCFMDPEYRIAPPLQDELFTLKYASSESGGAYCTGMSSFQDKSIREMSARVQKTSRRRSFQSSSSDDSSTSDTYSDTTNLTTEADESDHNIEDIDRPDIVMGEQDSAHESYLSMPTPLEEEDENDNLSPSDTAMEPPRNPRQGRRRNRKPRGNGRNQMTYSRKERKAQGKNQNSKGFPSQSAAAVRQSDDDIDNTYYIKLGEGIVLDWYTDAVAQLFIPDSKSNAEADERGHFVSHVDGKNLPFVKDPTVEEKKRIREARRQNGITLEDCFAETGKRERLSEDNAWYCNRCKKLQQATKTLELWTLPDILVVHLKRFGGNRSFRDKIDTMVNYPSEDLDMTQKVGLKEDGKEYIYDLFAVDNHFGGLGGGHYTAIAKNFYDGQWYDYNDSHCTKTSRIQSAAAYLLFYRRRSDKPLGPQYLQDLVLEWRNPSENADPNGEEAADDSETGEGRLGGPTSFLHGSSSVSAGVKVGTTNHLGLGAGGVGAGLTAGSNPTMKMSFSSSATGETQSKRFIGPIRPPQYSSDSGGTAWSFESLDDAPHTSNAADGSLEHTTEESDDVPSDVADIDSTGVGEVDSLHLEDAGGIGEEGQEL